MGDDHFISRCRTEAQRRTGQNHSAHQRGKFHFHRRSLGLFQLLVMATFTEHHDNQQDNRQHAAADHHHKAAVPAEEIDGVADDSARGHGTAKIAEQAGEARGGPGGFFGASSRACRPISITGP